MMAWCFSTRASIATVLTTHPCVSRRLRVKEQFWIHFPRKSSIFDHEMCFNHNFKMNIFPGNNELTKWIALITRQIWGIWKLRPAYSPETPNLGQNRWCFVPCDLEIWWMTLENNRASLLCCFKLCATFHSHWWIQTGVTVRKRPNLGQIRRFLEPCDLAIWCMTLKNNRAPLLCYFKLYASFRSHQWIQAGVTVRKRPIWVKIDDCFSRVTLQFEVWPCKTKGHLFYATSSFVHHFVAIGDF